MTSASGRQVNFYMTNEDERQFVDFLMTTGDVVLHAYTSMTPRFEPVRLLPEPYSGDFWYAFTILNRSISSNLRVRFISQQGYYVVDELNSSVIEFTRSVPETSIKAVHRGRIWADLTWLDNEKKIIVHKEPAFKKWYETIAGWIRRKYIRLDQLEYAGPDAIKLRDEGGALLTVPPTVGSKIYGKLTEEFVDRCFKCGSKTMEHEVLSRFEAFTCKNCKQRVLRMLAKRQSP